MSGPVFLLLLLPNCPTLPILILPSVLFLHSYLLFLIGRLSKWIWERKDSHINVRLSYLEELYFYIRFHLKPKLLEILNLHKKSKLFLWIACQLQFQHSQKLDEFCTRYHLFNCVLRDSTPHFVGPSVRRSVRWSVRWSVRRSVGHTLLFVFFFIFGFTAPAQMIW